MLSKIFITFIGIIIFNIKTTNSDRKFCEPIVQGYDTPKVYIPGFGSLIGSTTLSYWTSRKIHQYLGIPFAEPPVGNLRFKPPERKIWNPVNRYNATYFRPKCPQIVTEKDVQYFTTAHHQIEDCLYLNVFVPERDRDKHSALLPVIVYIHGGGFYQGSALEYCPNYLLEQDVILVTIQYRLGALGFLNLQIDSIAGNMGLMDQMLALEWVNENIKYFDGDNKRVTVAGSSAGAASISFLLVSPLVKPGLFQQAILQSGNLFNEWAYDYNPVEHAVSFAKLANCTSDDLYLLTNCLLAVPPFELTKLQKLYMGMIIAKHKMLLSTVNTGAATVQDAGIKKFLTEDPRTSVAAGRYRRIPVMVGTSKHEGSFILQGAYEFFLNPYKNDSCYMDKNGCVSNQYLKDDIYYDYLHFLGYSGRLIPSVELSKDIYFPENVRGNFISMAPGLIDLASDLIFKIQTMEFARLLYKQAPTYVYSFNYKGRDTRLGYGKPVDIPFEGGVAHADDLIYLFPFNGSSLNEEESFVARTMSELYTDFAINSGKTVTSKNISWPLMSSRSGPYLLIEKKISVQQDFLKQFAVSMKEDTKNAHNRSGSILMQKVCNVLCICTILFRYLFS